MNTPSIIYDKPFLTYEKLVEKLKSKNIVISDDEFAKKALSNFSYYNLINGYKSMFPINPDTESFQAPVLFEELYTIQIIDMSLNSLLLKNILYIERSLKSKLSYLVANNFGVFTDLNDMSNLGNPDDYLFENNYSRSNGKRHSILRSLKESLLDDRSIIIKHYRYTKNHIPPWILTTNIPFGLVIEWYNILRNNDKSIVCEQFIPNDCLSIDDKKEFLKKAFDLLRDYRNAIAHGNRTFSAQIRPVLPKRQLLALVPDLLTSNEYNSGLGQKDLYAVILLFIILLNDDYFIANFISDLNSIFLPYINVPFCDKSIFEIFQVPKSNFDKLCNLFLTV